MHLLVEKFIYNSKYCKIGCTLFINHSIKHISPSRSKFDTIFFLDRNRNRNKESGQTLTNVYECFFLISVL